MTFYVDMDGVLADFDRGLRELCGIEPLSVNEARSPEYEDAMWAAIRAVPHFYLSLEPMPGALEMFEQLSRREGARCEILTGIPKPRRGIVTAGEILNVLHAVECLHHLVIQRIQILVGDAHALHHIVHLRQSQILGALQAQTFIGGLVTFHSGNEHHRNILLAS